MKRELPVAVVRAHVGAAVGRAGVVLRIRGMLRHQHLLPVKDGENPLVKPHAKRVVVNLIR